MSRDEYSLVFRLRFHSRSHKPQWQARGRLEGMEVIYTPDSSSGLIPSRGHLSFKCREVDRMIVNGVLVVFLDLYEEIVSSSKEAVERGSLSSEKEVRRILNQASGLVGGPSRKKKSKKNRAA